MAMKNCASYNKKGECRHQRVVRFNSRGRNFLACDENCSCWQPKIKPAPWYRRIWWKIFGFPKFKKVTVPKLRRVWPELTPKDLVSVAPWVGKKVVNSDDLPVEATDTRTGEKVMVYKGCGGCDG